ncbi:MAG: fatty acid desaturase [Bacteriovorax sp.]
MINSPLRRNSDLRSLFFITFTLFLMGFSLSLSFNNFSLLTYLLSLLFLTFWVVVCTLINHNHRHHPIFKKNSLNQVLNLLISLAIGAPSTRLHLVHHFNHHLHYPSHEDWSHFELNAKGSGIMRIFTYLYNATKAMTKNREQLVKTKHHRKSLQEEKIMFYLASGIAMFINFKVFLFLILPSWILGLSLLLTSNLLNHDHCDTSSSINHSRDFLNGVENWFFCNNGYHTAHHLRPSLHWQDLPKLHAEKVLPYKRAEYSRGSFFYYLARYCLKQS